MPGDTATEPTLGKLDELIGGKELLKSIVQKLSSQLLLFSIAIIVFVMGAFFLFDGEALAVSLIILFVFLVGAAGYLFVEEKRAFKREDPGTMNRLLGNQVAHIVKPSSKTSTFTVDLEVQAADSAAAGARDVSVHPKTPAADQEISATGPAAGAQSASKSSGAFRIGDKVNVRFRASRDCYLTLLNIGTSGKLTVLFPNGIHPDNHVEGGAWHEIPGDSYGFEYELQGPPGMEKLKAVATLEPVALLESNFAPDGSIFRQAESTSAARDIVVVKEMAESLPASEWAEAYYEFQVTR